jgi:anti-sigma B factor antagonist
MADEFVLSLGGLRVRWEDPHDGEGRIAVEGDLDSLSLPVLTQTLAGLYDAGCFRIVVDLADLAFIDSSGLGGLVGAWCRCRDEGGHLSAVNPSKPVRRLMDLTGIGRFLLEPGDNG